MSLSPKKRQSKTIKRNRTNWLTRKRLRDSNKVVLDNLHLPE